MCTIDCLKPRHDYGKENCYLIFYHNVKARHTKKIKAEWFDYNYGDKVLWLLIRECKKDRKGNPVYRNIKLKNIDPKVDLISINVGVKKEHEKSQSC